jgi:hypothetical protein
MPPWENKSFREKERERRNKKEDHIRPEKIGMDGNIKGEERCRRLEHFQ